MVQRGTAGANSSKAVATNRVWLALVALALALSIVGFVELPTASATRTHPHMNNQFYSINETPDGIPNVDTGGLLALGQSLIPVALLLLALAASCFTVRICRLEEVIQ
jgi:ABC-type uncharacterized transport system YnjBCD permease subunit